jgi:hypothetical protein
MSGQSVPSFNNQEKRHSGNSQPKETDERQSIDIDFIFPVFEIETDVLFSQIKN